MTSSEPPRDRAWVEVSGTALRRNLDRIAAAAGRGVGVAPMVKADGYGLGVERVVRALRPARPAAWGVATIEEGVALRRLGVAGPVWICAPVPPQALARAVDAGLVPSISDLDSLAVLREIASARARTVPFQIDIDTGMGRSGFPIGAGTDADTVRGELSLAPGAPSAPPADWWPALVRTARESLRLHGIFTHLHSADEPDLAGARHQVRLFDDFVRAARATGRLPADAFIHCASSAGALRLQSETANVVRPGIFLYGASPVARGVSAILPSPVAAVRARVLLVRDVPAGATAGYGATYRASAPERWAAVGIGYGDGLPRALAEGGASALVGGRRAPVIGRISMDSTVLRIPSVQGRPLSVAPGDVVTFVGWDGDAEQRLEDVAEAAGTIPYEILTGLSRRLPRLSVQEAGGRSAAPRATRWNERHGGG